MTDTKKGTEMTENSEIPIIEILPDDTNAGIQETAHGYVFRQIYRLSTGEIVPSVSSKRLLRDAKAEVGSLPKAPASPMSAIFRDGQFVATRTEFYIGPRRSA